MNLDLSAASLVRAGSGFLFLLLGLTVLAFGRARRENAAFGVAMAAFGLSFISTNFLYAGGASTLPWVVSGVVGLVGTAALLVVLWPSRAVVAFSLGIAAIFVPLVALASDGAMAATAGFHLDPEVWSTYHTFVLVYVVFFALSLGYLVHVTRRLLRAREPREEQGALLLLAGWGLYFAFRLGENWVIQARLPPGTGPEAYLFWSVVAVVFAGIVVALLAAAHRVKRAREVAWLLLAAMLAGAVDQVAVGDGFVSPGVGIVRTLGAATVAYAVFRMGALGFDPALPAMRRGTTATLVLAVFFIVAQIAQNLLSDQYGLVLGGIVAGTFLFAANPIQRAVEAFALGAPSRRVPVEEPTRDASGAKREAYKRALRLALRDRVLTPDEEIELAHVAHELGLGAVDAVRLRHEVEGELRGAGVER